MTPFLLRDWCLHVCVLKRLSRMDVDTIWASTITSQIIQLVRHLICAGYCFCAVILIIPGPFSRFGVNLITMQSLRALAWGCEDIQHTQLMYIIGADECLFITILSAGARTAGTERVSGHLSRLNASCTTPLPICCILSLMLQTLQQEISWKCSVSWSLAELISMIECRIDNCTVIGPHSAHFSQGCRRLEIIPECIGWEAGKHPGHLGSPSGRTYTRSFTCGQFRLHRIRSVGGEIWREPMETRGEERDILH